MQDNNEAKPNSIAHQDRVRIEYKRLNVKIAALDKFVNSDKIHSLEDIEQAQLKDQLRIMKEYAGALKGRIDGFRVPIQGGDDYVQSEEIDDINSFAMAIDAWHSTKMEQGNRMLNVPAESLEYEDVNNPGKSIKLDMTGDVLMAYRIGVMTALHLFAELPFGAELATGDDVEAKEEDADAS